MFVTKIMSQKLKTQKISKRHCERYKFSPAFHSSQRPNHNANHADQVRP